MIQKDNRNKRELINYIHVEGIIYKNVYLLYTTKPLK